MGEQLTAGEWLESFGEALASGAIEQVTQLFGEECYWRDLISMTWNIHTSEGRDAIADMLGSVGTDA